VISITTNRPLLLLLLCKHFTHTQSHNNVNVRQLLESGSPSWEGS